MYLCGPLPWVTHTLAISSVQIRSVGKTRNILCDLKRMSVEGGEKGVKIL